MNMMATIYQSADMIHALLGEEDKDTGRSFQLIKALASWDRKNKKAQKNICLNDIKPETMSSEELT